MAQTGQPLRERELENRDLLSNVDSFDDEEQGRPGLSPGSGDGESLQAEIMDVDGGKAWIIVGASFATHFIVFGLQYTFGVFLTSIQDEFNTDRATVSWIVTINTSVQLFSGMVTGRLVDRFGFRIICFIGTVLMTLGLFLSSFVTDIWQLYLSFGIMCGVGGSFAFLPSISNISHWFIKRRGLATVTKHWRVMLGIAVSGSGVGQITMAQVSSSLLSAFGWRSSFLVLSLMAFCFLLIPSLLLKRRIPSAQRASFSNALRDRRFHVIVLSCFIGAWGYMVPFVHVVPFAEDMGLSTSRATNMLSYMGAASTFGRIAIGAIADKVGRRQVMQLTMLIIGIATMVWPFTTSEAALIVYCVVFGLFAGGYVSLQPTLLAEYFDVAYLASISGVLYFFIGIGVLFGAPAAGFMYDATGTYKMPGLIGGGLMALSSAAFFGLLFVRPPSSGGEKAVTAVEMQ